MIWFHIYWLQWSKTFVFKQTLLSCLKPRCYFWMGNSITAKYHKWEYSCLPNFNALRRKKKMYLMTTPKKCKQRKEALCQHNAITKSRKIVFEKYSLYQRRRKKCFPIAREEKSLETQHFSRDVKRQPKKLTFLKTGVSLTMKRKRGINNHNGYENITPSFCPFVFWLKINIWKN